MSQNQQPGQGQGRPRAESSFSFRSKHSQKSSGSGKIDLHETHEEKQSKRLQTKADPSMALNEAEPSAVSQQKTSLASIRAIQHLDANGNPIADPDRNNPTRSRWERPLDTIRSFEAAIDGNYSRKMRPESVIGGDNQSTFNRRSSYYAGTQVSMDERPRYQQNGPQSGYGNGYGAAQGYGRGRSQSYRPESYAESGMGRPDSYYQNGDNNNYGPSNGYTPNRARYPRTASEPHFNNGGGIYPVAGQQQSYETVTTASGSGSSPDTIGYSTDPSSENSSVDRIAPPREPQDNYGFDGFGNTPQYAPPGSNLQQYGSNGYTSNGGQHQLPPVPRKEVGAPRVPVKLGNTSGNAGPPARPAVPEKRKSWFGKRFGKS